MQIDQPGGDVEATALDDLEGPPRVDGLLDRRHFAAVDGDVADRAQPVPGIDQVSAPQQQVVSGSLAERAEHASANAADPARNSRRESRS